MKRPYKIEVLMTPAQMNLETRAIKREVFRWKITAPNGQIINHQYNTKAGAQKSLAAFLAAVADGNYVIAKS